MSEELLFSEDFLWEGKCYLVQVYRALHATGRCVHSAQTALGPGDIVISDWSFCRGGLAKATHGITTGDSLARPVVAPRCRRRALLRRLLDAQIATLLLGGRRVHALTGIVEAGPEARHGKESEACHVF